MSIINNTNYLASLVRLGQKAAKQRLLPKNGPLLSFSTNNNAPPVIDYFKTMGVEHTFNISQEDLKKSYKKLMTKYHPDRHTLKSLTEQEDTAEKATTITRSFAVLQDDHERALHLLELGGMRMEDNISGEILGGEFLMEVMELREEIDNTTSEVELKKLFADNKERMNNTCEKLGVAFSQNDLQEAKRLTAMLQYWKRIDELITDQV